MNNDIFIPEQITIRIQAHFVYKMQKISNAIGVPTVKYDGVIGTLTRNKNVVFGAIGPCPL